MSVITNTWHQLVQRRLLPVAVLLLAALVAVPLLLAKDPEPVAAPAVKKPAATDTAVASLAETIVTPVDETADAPRRRVLGARKNPFEPAPAPKAEKAKADAGGAANSGGKPAAGAETEKAPSGGSSSPAGKSPAAAPAPAPAVPAPTPEAEKTYETLSLTVRFGDSEADSHERMNLARLRPRPD